MFKLGEIIERLKGEMLGSHQATLGIVTCHLRCTASRKPHSLHSVVVVVRNWGMHVARIIVKVFTDWDVRGVEIRCIIKLDEWSPCYDAIGRKKV